VELGSAMVRPKSLMAWSGVLGAAMAATRPVTGNGQHSLAHAGGVRQRPPLSRGEDEGGGKAGQR
jgi:hypothetical protein